MDDTSFHIELDLLKTLNGELNLFTSLLTGPLKNSTFHMPCHALIKWFNGSLDLLEIHISADKNDLMKDNLNIKT